MSNRFLHYYTNPNVQPKRGRKDGCIKHLKEQNAELTKALMFAMTLIPKDKLPNGFTPSSFFWLKSQGRKLEYDDPSDIGIDFTENEEE